MITPSLESALRTVYGRIPNQRASHYQTEVSERVLNELVSHNNATDLPEWQIRNARSNAAKVLKRRSHICPRVDIEDLNSINAAGDDCSIACFEIIEWLRTTNALVDGERAILIALAADVSLGDLAAQLATDVERLSVQVCRLRRRARAAWLADTR